jgi:hypothetical protein
LSNNKQSRCHKLPHDPQKVEACLLKMGVRCLPKHAVEVVVDLSSTADESGARQGLKRSRRIAKLPGVPSATGEVSSKMAENQGF